MPLTSCILEFADAWAELTTTWQLAHPAALAHLERRDPRFSTRVLRAAWHVVDEQPRHAGEVARLPVSHPLALRITASAADRLFRSEPNARRPRGAPPRPSRIRSGRRPTPLRPRSAPAPPALAAPGRGSDRAPRGPPAPGLGLGLAWPPGARPRLAWRPPGLGFGLLRGPCGLSGLRRSAGADGAGPRFGGGAGPAASAPRPTWRSSRSNRPSRTCPAGFLLEGGGMQGVGDPIEDRLAEGRPARPPDSARRRGVPAPRPALAPRRRAGCVRRPAPRSPPPGLRAVRRRRRAAIAAPRGCPGPAG